MNIHEGKGFIDIFAKNEIHVFHFTWKKIRYSGTKFEYPLYLPQI